MSNNVLTKDQLKTIKKYREKKMTLRAIAKIFGVSHECIRKALLRMSIILLTVACGTENQDQEKQAEVAVELRDGFYIVKTDFEFTGTYEAEFDNSSIYIRKEDFNTLNSGEMDCDLSVSINTTIEGDKIVLKVLSTYSVWCDEFEYGDNPPMTITETDEGYIFENDIHYLTFTRQ